MAEMYSTLKLVEGREKSAQFLHPWIFSRALAPVPRDVRHGSLVRVMSHTGECVGVGTYSAHTSIAVRLWDFCDTVIDGAWIERTIRAAHLRREQSGFGPGTHTTGYRVIFAEADNMPGVIIDRYGDVFVLQIATAGAEQLKKMICEVLVQIFHPSAIIERSDTGIRADEELSESVGVIYGNFGAGGDAGTGTHKAQFTENGLNAIAYPLTGQKTGFFLDQKELRRAIERHARGRNVANICSYTGMAGVYAMRGGARVVHHVDSSAVALQGCEEHRTANAISAAQWSTEQADVFAWLGAQKNPQYDMVCIDPPALIKSQRDVEEGKKAYHFLNRAALRLVQHNGIFVTSSCSQFLPEEDVLFLLRRASVQNHLRLHVLATIRQSSDHPTSVYFPESQYLKSVVCMVSR